MFDSTTWVVIAAISYFVLLFGGYIWGERRRKENKEEFFKALKSAFNDETLKASEDIFNLYKGIFGEHEESKLISGINKCLREFLVKLRTDSFRYNVEPKEKMQELVTFINAEIKKNEDVQPFADVPDLERNYLIDTRNLIDANNKEEALRKLIDLGGLIQTREETSIKLQKSNRWSVPLALLGLVLTIIFGTMQIWQT